MEYLLKACGLITIFYICYKLFLQRETFYQQNRCFLLLGLAISLSIPLLIIPIYIEQPPIDLKNIIFTETINTTTPSKTSFNTSELFMSIYFIGVIVFFLRFIFQIISLFQIFGKNQVEIKDGYRFVKTNTKDLPFSFFKWIVYDPSLFKINELEHIITHEKTHANQYHSIDSLLVQISSIILWFNPIIWLYNRDLKQNLEFIADELAQNNIGSKKSYQYTLLKTSMPSNQLALTNNFYNSLIKKRIVMLQKSKSKKINYLKYLLILPAFCWFLMSFNTQEVFAQTQKEHQEINNQVHYGDKLDIYIEKDMPDSALESVKRDLEKQGYIMKLGHIKRNNDNYIISLSITISYKESNVTSFSSNSNTPIKTIKIAIDRKDHSISIGNSENHVFNLAPAIANAQLQTDKNPLYVIDGKIITEKGFSLHKYDIKSINVIKGKQALQKYGDKGKNGVIEITNKSKGLNKIHLKSANGKAPLYIINDTEVEEKEFEMVEHENIKSISVLKGEKAIEKYGNKGKDGVVIMNTKQKHTFKLPKLALYIIDGIESNLHQFEKLANSDIESINILKNKMATEKYGTKGKHGVIEVTTKE